MHGHGEGTVDKMLLAWMEAYQMDDCKNSLSEKFKKKREECLYVVPNFMFNTQFFC